jgi:hypothetical protein
MYLGINNGEEGFIIPVLPEKLEINENGDNKTYEVVNLGEINSINIPKLTEISFESFFPMDYVPYMRVVYAKDEIYVAPKPLFTPEYYVNKIRAWRNARQKIRFIFTGGPLEVNDLFTIENFKLSEKGGEVGDIYYSIELKLYRKYMAKKAIIVQPTPESAPVMESQLEERPVETPQPQTHTVVEGDTLWAIAKRYLGDGSRYPEIAQLNNIENPDLIYPGQVFTIP